MSIHQKTTAIAVVSILKLKIIQVAVRCFPDLYPFSV